MSVNAGQVHQNNLQRQLMSERINLLGAEIHDLTKELEYAKEERDKAYAETESLEKKYQEFSRCINEMQTRNDILENQKISILQDIDKYRIEVRNLQEKIQVCKKEFDSISADKNLILDDIRTYNDKLYGLIDDYKTRQEELGAITQTYNDVCSALDETNARAQASLAAIQEEYKELEREKEYFAEQKSQLDKYKTNLNIYASRLNTEMQKLGLSGTINPL